MRRLMNYDLKLGISSNIKKLLLFVVLVTAYNIVGSHSIAGYAELNNLKPDVLDYFCYVLGGPRFIPEGMIEMYQIPVMWLMLQIMIAYTIGYYAVTDLHRYGQQVLLRSTSRTKWWLSKVIWNLITVLIMYSIVFGITLLSAYVSGASFEWKLTDDIAMEVCNINMIPEDVSIILIFIFVMPVIVSVTLSIMQMVIALITSPIIGFIVTQSIAFLATIYTNKIFISNYAMLSHSKYTCFSNIDYHHGLIICGVLMIVSVTAGSIYFMHCNILPKSRAV